jgi:hypothetical protein
LRPLVDHPCALSDRQSDPWQVLDGLLEDGAASAERGDPKMTGF